MSGGNAYKRKSHRRIEVITSVAAVVVPVSYTHLDVYKRQVME